jgi:hypothetical protein
MFFLRNLIACTMNYIEFLPTAKGIPKLKYSSVTDDYATR